MAARAFYTDPFFVHLGPPAFLRNRGLAIFFRAMLRHLGPKARLVTVRDDQDRVVGVAAWVTTGGYPQPILTQLAQIPGTLRALYRRPRALVDGQFYLNAIAKAHPKDEHWYLFLLVADPEFQRRGIGAALLDDALTLIDEEGVAAYLETQKHENLAYYQRFGFSVTDTLTPVKGGPPLYCMRREAR